MSPSDKFNKANRNFKRVYYAGKSRERQHKPNKYKWLPDWTLNKSNYLLHEHDKNRTNKKVYKRGAIVNIDFGVNVGQELTGNHFGIILNKHDNYRNDKLTVIPLTSHEHPNTVKLDKTILNLSINYFIDSLMRLSLVSFSIAYLQYNLAHEINSDEKTPYELLLDQVDKIQSQSGKAVALKFADSINNAIPDYETATTFLKSYPPFIEHKENLFEYISKSGFMDNQAIEGTQIQEAYNKYGSYNKETWAKVTDIQTVSKSRLIKINSADPIGDIKVSPSVLNTIDNELKRQFTF